MIPLIFAPAAPNCRIESQPRAAQAYLSVGRDVRSLERTLHTFLQYVLSKYLALRQRRCFDELKKKERRRRGEQSLKVSLMAGAT